MVKSKTDKTEKALEILEKHVEMFEDPKIANGTVAQLTARSAKKLFNDLGMTDAIEERASQREDATHVAFEE